MSGPSQSGPLSSAPFTAMPIHRVSKLDSEPFRVLLLRRLRLPLPFIACTCRCGRPLDAFRHHRAACSTGGLLGRRGFAAESAISQIFREGGAKVSTNVMVRDLDITPPHRSDLRSLEVVAERLTLFGRVPIGHCGVTTSTRTALTDAGLVPTTVKFCMRPAS